MFIPAQQLDARTGLIGEDEGSPFTPRRVELILDILRQRVDPRRISTGFTARKTFSGVSIFEGPEDIGELRGMAAHAYPTRQKEGYRLIYHS